MTRVLALLGALVLTGAALAVGWGGLTPPDGATTRPPTSPADPSPTPAPSGGPSSPSGPASTPPPPAPAKGACYRLSWDEALAPTSSSSAVPCGSRHTAVTYAVGRLDTVVDGHLLAVDSPLVRDEVAGTCTDRFARHVGGTLEQRRLSVLRPVWFTPSVEQSDAGADWFRCDAVALAREGALAVLGPRTGGVLSTAAGQSRYGLCSTAEPGTAGSRRVPCATPHTWRAVRTVTFGVRAWPGTSRVRAAGAAPCRAAGRAASGGALDFRWGHEWPTAEQWRAGQRFGICWVPD